MKRLILGSQSAGRKRVLERMGYEFDVIPANIDEKAIRKRGVDKLVMALAHAKATAIMTRIPRSNAILLTSDQVVVCNGRIYEKPTSKREVEDFFEQYKKYPAETVTSVVVTDVFSRWRVGEVDRAKIWFAPIPENVLEAYIESWDPFVHAGGFDREHHIIEPYVQYIEGDPNSVTGLPVEVARRLLNVYQTG